MGRYQCQATCNALKSELVPGRVPIASAFCRMTWTLKL
jgi:hypothetical protein